MSINEYNHRADVVTRNEGALMDLLASPMRSFGRRPMGPPLCCAHFGKCAENYQDARWRQQDCCKYNIHGNYHQNWNSHHLRRACTESAHKLKHTNDIIRAILYNYFANGVVSARDLLLAAHVVPGFKCKYYQYGRQYTQFNINFIVKESEQAPYVIQ